jgi:hypothetical protein
MGCQRARGQARGNKSLFASFSSEKAESLGLFLKKKKQKDFYVLAA